MAFWFRLLPDLIIRLGSVTNGFDSNSYDNRRVTQSWIQRTMAGDKEKREDGSKGDDDDSASLISACGLVDRQAVVEVQEEQP